MGSKPPAAVAVRISKGERHDLGAAAPFSITTSSLQGRVGGSAFTPKLVELVFGPESTRLAEKLSPCNAYYFGGALRALASLGVCGPVCLHNETWLPSVLL